MATRLVRRGYRLAERMHASFVTVHVQMPGAVLGQKEQALLEEAYHLTRDLGGQVVELQGDPVAEEVVRYVREAGVTFIVMGQSARSRWEEITRGSIINRIMRETRNVDIVVVADANGGAVEAQQAPSGE